MDLVPREVVEGKLLQRSPPPESKRLLEHLCGLGRRSVVERTPPVIDESLEKVCIHGDRVRPQCVAGLLCHEEAATVAKFVFGFQQPPQMRDVPLNRLRRRLGRMVAPQRIDDAIGRDHLSAMDQQQDEQGSLAPGRQLDLPALAAAYLERTKDVDIH